MTWVSACVGSKSYIHFVGFEMIYEWDEAKRASNIAKHGIDFEEVRSFDWDTALIREDMRRDYGERRWMAIGTMGFALVVAVVVYTERGEATRIISARLASNRERAFYETAFA